jgi:hypothetical protein
MTALSIMSPEPGESFHPAPRPDKEVAHLHSVEGSDPRGWPSDIDER